MFSLESIPRPDAGRELVVVAIGAILAWLVATVAVTQSTHWHVLAVLPLTLLFGLFVGAVTLAVATDPKRSWRGVVSRGAVAVLVGAVVGEIAAMVVFSGSIDRRLDEQAARAAAATPAVHAVSADLAQLRGARAQLDNAVDAARDHQDHALVIARCEYNPSPACPQTRITGVPGEGPETRTANQLLSDAQRELDTALAARDAKAPALDAEISGVENVLAQTRHSAAAAADESFGARWVAMHQHTLSSAAAMVLWAVTLAFFALLSLLPLILKLLRGETARDRGVVAGAERDRAKLHADTAIAVKRAEVRAEIETMWAEQQLASARLAVAAQTEIDRELHRRRVEDLLDAPVQAELSRSPEPVKEDMYLPIEAEAQAASMQPPDNLPARVGDEDKQPLLHTAARWIRPLVPPIVARAIDTTAHPMRAARQVFEEVEEITFSLKRTYKATVRSEETSEPAAHKHSVSADPRRVESSSDSWHLPVNREHRSELAVSSRPGELRAGGNPRELPSPE